MKITFNNEETELKGSRVHSIIKQNINDKVNKLEVVPFQLTNPAIQTALDNSNAAVLRKKVGRILAEEGDAAVFILPFQNTFILDAMHVESFSQVGKYNMEVTGRSGKNFIYQGQEYPIFTKYSYQNKQVTLSRYIELVNSDKSTSMIEVEKNITFSWLKELPVEIFLNNEERKSDIEYAGVVSDLIRLDYFDQEMRPEWERTRTLPIYNTNFTDVNPAQATAELDKGRGYLSDDGINSKLGSGQSIQPASGGTAVLQAQIIFLEDDIYKKLGLQRDTLNNGSNNHNLEVITSNQYGLELLLAQKALREQNWNSVIGKLADALKTPREQVTLAISPIEQAKLDLLASTVLEAQAKAANLAAQKPEGK